MHKGIEEMSIEQKETCNGCDLRCEYGYFQYGKEAHYYPTLNGHIFTHYWLSRSEHKFIEPNELTTKSQAIAMAREIAKRCTKNLQENNKQK